MKKVILLQIQPQLFKTKEQVLENIQTKEVCLLMPDHRSLRRNGRATSWIEKWTLGSINIPYTQLLKDGNFTQRSVKKSSVPRNHNVHLWIRCNSLY
jgi:thiosulfate/3-mercaptopyruvate sulfurtransferase